MIHYVIGNCSGFLADRIDKLSLICIKDGKILQVRSKGKDTFYLPGGKREKGETDAQALSREIKEELDVSVVEGSMRRFGVFEAQAHGKPEGVIVKATCYFADFSGNPRASSEIEELAWLGYADLEKVPPLGKVVFEALHQKGILK